MDATPAEGTPSGTAPGTAPGTLANLGLAAGLVAALALAVGCLLVLRPFLSALLWAAILVYSTWPGYRFLIERVRLPAGLAAALMVLVEFLLLGLPLVYAAPTRREQVDGLRESVERMLTEGLPGLGTWLGGLPLVGPFIGERLGALSSGFSGLTELLRPYAGDLAQATLSVLLAVLSGLAEVLVALFLAFFLYRDGRAIAARAERVLGKLAGNRARRLVQLTGDITTGVIYGLLGTAVAQGVMTFFGLWVAGVPQPVLLGVVAGSISVLPVGAPLVWIPATLWLFTRGETGWGIFMGLYGAFGISSVDNFIRPWLISRGADLSLLLTLLGALGGVIAFGFLGLFLGPVLLAVGASLIQDWIEHPNAEDTKAT